MGSWSVSCGISNIAIAQGQECVLLPLIENRSEYGGYTAITLPIFGKYNDYGGMEDIIEDDNTKLIEVHLGISITEFVEYLVDGKFTYDRREVVPIIEKLKQNGTYNQIENWRFMWIDKKVYDFMIVSVDQHDNGSLSFGTPEMLTALGFTLLENSKEFPNYAPSRFNEKWDNGVVKVYSDGTSILTMSNQPLFYFGKGCGYSIETHFEIPENLQHLKTKNKQEAWRVLNTTEQQQILGYVFGNSGYGLDISKSLLLLAGITVEPKTISDKYLHNLDAFGDRIAMLSNIRRNLHPMSGRLYPHVLHLTPQCGEYSNHQKILEAFTEINNSYVNDEDNDE